MFKVNNINQMRHTAFFLLIVFSFLFSCGNTSKSDPAKNSSSIEGVWYFVENDSLYGEIFFTEDRFWTYDDRGGVIHLRYELRNDSVEFFDWSNRPYIISKYTPVNKDEFVLSRDKINTHYYRLNVPVDTASIIAEDEKAFNNYIVEGLRKRRYQWESRDGKFK